jgi:alkylation response protein AidB-like acyl-CoA dehydrogenase
VDFELGPEERAFEAEVEAFLREHASPEVMDASPEQLSQTVDTPAKRAFMRKLAERGIGYSEPGAGSDAANMQLKATKVEGGWRLDGQKIWTTSAHFADYYWLGARTDPAAPKHKGITLFLIPMDAPGLTIRPTWTIGDERTNEVFFDGVFAPDACVVGEVNRGWSYICEALDLERFAMMPIGPLEMKLEALVGRLREARRDGRPLREDPSVRARTARLVAELEVARMLQRRAISAAVKGRIPTVESSMYKLFMNETGKRRANAALDLLGPEAQLRAGESEAPLAGRFERSYRYTVVDTIGGGTSEIQKNIVARRGLGLPPCY